MNKNLLKIILKHKQMFVPLIFTRKQLNVLKKRIEGMQLSNAERKTLYTSIKKKMEALNILGDGEMKAKIYLAGHENIIGERLEEAEKLISEYGAQYGKVFISGSFLFSRHYNDIDIFILTQRGYKEKWHDKKHLIFLSEARLAKPIFQSAALISIGNFIIPRKIEKKRPKLDDLMSDYHEAVIEKIKKEKKLEATRRIVFGYWLFAKNRLLNAKDIKKFSVLTSLSNLDSMMKELCKILFSKHYLYVGLHDYIKTLEESIKNIKLNHHLLRYKSTYEEMIYERGRSKTQVA